jgi:hypothetical protein
MRGTDPSWISMFLGRKKTADFADFADFFMNVEQCLGREHDLHAEKNIDIKFVS